MNPCRTLLMIIMLITFSREDKLRQGRSQKCTDKRRSVARFTLHHGFLNISITGHLMLEENAQIFEPGQVLVLLSSPICILFKMNIKGVSASGNAELKSSW